MEDETVTIELSERIYNQVAEYGERKLGYSNPRNMDAIVVKMLLEAESIDIDVSLTVDDEPLECTESYDFRDLIYDSLMSALEEASTFKESES
jgi:hypothetical protein